MQQASQDAFWVVDQMFGSPDEPNLPQVILDDEDLATVVSLDNLHRASGPESEEGRGLYRLLCASCHGISGDGRGPLAQLKCPIPDYRWYSNSNQQSEVRQPKTIYAADHLRNSRIQYEQRGTTIGVRKLKRGEEAQSWLPEEITKEDIDALVDYVIYPPCEANMNACRLTLAF